MSDDWVRIEITSGIVRDTRLIGQDGFRRLDDETGTRRFFVEAINSSGGRTCLWDGDTHIGAVLAARGFAGDLPAADLAE